ncbi:cordon-bleu protein-like 1 isoform X2 [Protopterus annectens]|nr:cordon-bleu protein-like 1 isoform X2 [Protopterus annectens]XP_043930765.1 cordon-bleu protein-like 1 isoform X2 [Protopterus annectens]
MEPNENSTDRDIDLKVVLPGGVEKSTTVPGTKPVMDLLILLCGKYHLNPSSYAIELMSADKNQVRYKPNTLIGTLEVGTVILKQKNVDDKNKKPTPVAPEQTIRLVINYKKSQKTVVRVSPRVPLQELIPAICEKCDFDPKYTVLLKDYQSQEVLDLTKPLNDLGLKEIYAADTRRASSPAESMESFSQQELFQGPHNDTIQRDKDGKGLLGLFRRSKKKQDQTASAPATPSLNQQRPGSMVKSSEHPVLYESNTLPAEMPKKRRAPLPPMVSSQSVPKDLGHSRSVSSVSQSSIVMAAEQNSTGDRSLQSNGTPFVSSIKRTKRKAPSPPPQLTKAQQDQSTHNSTETESVEMKPSLEVKTDLVTDLVKEGDTPTAASSTTSNSMNTDEDQTVSAVGTDLHAPSTKCLVSTHRELEPVIEPPDEASISASTGTPDTSEISHESGIGLECSLDEINEKEETGTSDKEDTESRPRIQQEVLNPSSPDTGRNECTSQSSPTDVIICENVSKNVEKEQRLELSTADKALSHDMDQKVNGSFTQEKDRNLENANLNKKVDCGSSPSADVEEGDQMRTASNTGEANGAQTEKSTDTSSESPNHRKKWDVIVTMVEVKKVPAVEDLVENKEIVTAPITSDNSTSSVQDLKGALPSKPESKGNVHFNDTTNLAETSEAQNGHAKLHSDPPKQETSICDASSSDERTSPAHTISVAAEDSRNVQLHASAKLPPLYKQECEPKPKPSNEITRDYIPKIGMTTYKIVPQKSFDHVKAPDTEHINDVAKASEPTGLQQPDNMARQEIAQKPNVARIPTLPEMANQPSQSNINKAAVINGDGAAFHNNSGVSDGTSKCVSEKKAGMATSALPVICQQNVPPQDATKSNVEAPDKHNAANNKMKPGSFYLQLMKRTPGYYVTSAAAKNAAGPISPTTPPPVSPKTTSTPCSPPPVSPKTFSTPRSPPPVMPKSFSTSSILPSANTSGLNSLPHSTNPPAPSSPPATNFPPSSLSLVSSATSGPPGPASPPPPCSALATNHLSPPVSPHLVSSPSASALPTNHFLATDPSSLLSSSSSASVSLSGSDGTVAEVHTVSSVNKSILPAEEIIPPPPEFAESIETIPEEEKSEHFQTSTEPSQTLRLSSKQPESVSLRTRTHVTPRPYSCTGQSAFALAVSSAVKRSQSFDKGSSVKNNLPKVPPSADVPVNSTDSASNFVENPDESSKPNHTQKYEISENGKQAVGIQPPHQIPSSRLPPLSRSSSFPKPQITDPEQIRQQLCDAIRSGKAAARLKRVHFASGMSLNGNTSLNPPLSSQLQ